MISAFYTASTAAVELQKGFDVTANNMANVSSTGYKTSTPTFADLIYTNINAEQGKDVQLKSGHGTKLDKTDTQFTQGNTQKTNRDLDFALETDKCFFAVNKSGKVEYTRNGSFHVSVEQGGNYLVSSDGGYVLDSKGQKITVQNESDNINVGVYTFPNCDGLERAAGTTFTATGISGAAKAVTGATVKKGSLEDSTVNVADEMASVIELQRSFQLNTKIIQLSDEISQTINGLR